MTSNGRDEQDARVTFGPLGSDVAFEMDQPAKRPLPDNLFPNLDIGAVDERRVQSEFRFDIAPRRALEHLEGGGSVAAGGCVGEGIERIVEQQTEGISRHSGRPHRGLAQLKPLVEQ